MQRAVAIVLAGGLLAASAGAFALAQFLKLERSPIEAIRVDPTPNHGRGLLDRHDSALFSPHCAAPCVPNALVRFRVHTSGPVTAEVIAPGGKVVRKLGRLPHASGRVLAVWNGRETGGKGSGRRLLPAEGESLGSSHRVAQPARPRHRRARAEHARLAPRDLTRLRLLRRPRDRRRARQRATGGPRTCRCGRARASCAPYASRAAPGRSRSAGRHVRASAARLRPTAGTGCG